MSEPRKATIYAVSDGRGTTCELVVRAALAQFPDTTCDIIKRGNVTRRQDVQALVREASARQAIIYYTLVRPEAREEMKSLARELMVPVVDVMGPACQAMFDLFQSRPADIPGLLYKSNPEHFDMMEAIEFTLSHDDGRRARDLHKAHVVLVGVSRAGNSSTAYYLAYHGVKVANVPLVIDMPPPPQLLELDPAKVVGLRVNKLRLSSIRKARVQTMGVVPGGYVEERTMAKEIRWANGLIERHGWHMVDASYQAIEEVAKEVIKVCGLTANLPKI